MRQRQEIQAVLPEYPPAGRRGGLRASRYPDISNTWRRTISVPAERLPVLVESITRRIYVIRGQKIMLESNLASLPCPTRRLNALMEHRVAMLSSVLNSNRPIQMKILITSGRMCKLLATHKDLAGRVEKRWKPATGTTQSP